MNTTIKRETKRKNNETLLERLRWTYIELQVKSHHPLNVDVAVATDGIRASLRDTIAEAEGRNSEDIQNEIEETARRTALVKP